MGNKISIKGSFDPNKMRNRVIIQKIASTPLDLYLFYWLGYRQIEKSPPILQFADYWNGESLYQAYKRISIIRHEGGMITLVTTPSQKRQTKLQNFTVTLLSLSNRGVRIWKKAKEDKLWRLLEEFPKKSYLSPERFTEYFYEHVDLEKGKLIRLRGYLRPVSRTISAFRWVRRQCRRIKLFTRRKVLRSKLKHRTSRAKREFLSDKILEAYSRFHAILENKKYSEQTDLLETVQDYEKKTLEKVGEKIQEISHEAIEKIKVLQVEYDGKNIVKTCERFFINVRKYPIVEENKKYELMVKETHDLALSQVWEAEFNSVSEEIKRLLKIHNETYAITKGEEFIAEIQTYPKVPQLNIFKDSIYLLIEPPIIHRYAEQFKTIRDQETLLVTQRDFDTIIGRWEGFITSTEKYNNIQDVFNLERQAKRRLQEIVESRPHIEAIDDYNEAIEEAFVNYDDGLYEQAISYMHRAIEVKKEHEKERMYLIKDTKEHVNNAQFIIACRKRIIIRNIESLIQKGSEYIRNGDQENGKRILRKAQNMYNNFSQEEKKSHKCKMLIRQIRNGINRTPQKETIQI